MEFKSCLQPLEFLIALICDNKFVMLFDLTFMVNIVLGTILLNGFNHCTLYSFLNLNIYHLQRSIMSIRNSRNLQRGMTLYNQYICPRQSFRSFHRSTNSVPVIPNGARSTSTFSKILGTSSLDKCLMGNISRSNNIVRRPNKFINEKTRLGSTNAPISLKLPKPISALKYKTRPVAKTRR